MIYSSGTFLHRMYITKESLSSPILTMILWCFLQTKKKRKWQEHLGQDATTTNNSPLQNFTFPNSSRSSDSTTKDLLNAYIPPEDWNSDPTPQQIPKELLTPAVPSQSGSNSYMRNDTRKDESVVTKTPSIIRWLRRPRQRDPMGEKPQSIEESN